jgi:hypothetical protein
MISCDVPRCIFWFLKLAKELGLGLAFGEDAEIVATRLLRHLVSSHALTYYQGYDRFVFISYLLGLKLISALNLPQFVAEAIGFAISGRLLTIANFPQYLRPGAIFTLASLDEEVRHIRPDIARDLKRAGHSAIHFAHRWKLLWFADEHRIEGIWLIWDNIIARLPELAPYLEKLCVSHIMQIQLRPERLALETIQSYTEWDVPRIIADADRPRFNEIIKLVELFPPVTNSAHDCRWRIGRSWKWWPCGLVLIILFIWLICRW